MTSGRRTHPMQGTRIATWTQHRPLRLLLPLPHAFSSRFRCSSPSRPNFIRGISVFIVFVRFRLLLLLLARIPAISTTRIAAWVARWRTTLSATWLRCPLRRLPASCSRCCVILRVLCVLTGRHALAISASRCCRRRRSSSCRSWIGLLLAGIGTALAGIWSVGLATTRCSVLWLL